MVESQIVGSAHRRPVQRNQLASTESRLLAGLLDIGMRGASVDELARLLWYDTRPDQWRGLLDFHLGVLGSRLPAGVDVRTDAARARFSLQFVKRPRGASRLRNIEASEQAAGALAKRLSRHRRSLVVGPTSHSTAEALALVASGEPKTTTYYVYGEGAPLVPLGAFAATFATLRTALLDLHQSGRQTNARIAWRLISTHLTERARVSRQRLLVEDAHLLDNESLELLSYLAIYPIPALSQLIIAGDDGHERPEWAALLRVLATNDFEVFASI